MRLNREPLHYQIRKILREKIQSGYYEEKLPSEMDLMKEFSVSRATIREAISGCVQEGLLYRIQGKGTYVSNKPIKDWLGHLYGFSESMEKLGYMPDAKVIKSLKIEDNEMSELLEVDDVYLIERLRLIDNKPIAIEITYFPYEIGVKLAEIEDLVYYSYIENELGIRIINAKQSISAMVATQTEAKPLDVKVGHPLLKVKRIVYGENKVPIQMARIIFRGDQYALNIDLERSIVHQTT